MTHLSLGWYRKRGVYVATVGSPGVDANLGRHAELSMTPAGAEGPGRRCCERLVFLLSFSTDGRRAHATFSFLSIRQETLNKLLLTLLLLLLHPAGS